MMLQPQASTVTHSAACELEVKSSAPNALRRPLLLCKHQWRMRFGLRGPAHDARIARVASSDVASQLAEALLSDRGFASNKDQDKRSVNLI